MSSGVNWLYISSIWEVAPELRDKAHLPNQKQEEQLMIFGQHIKHVLSLVLVKRCSWLVSFERMVANFAFNVIPRPERTALCDFLPTGAMGA
jgi:hypothetical protein